MSHFIGFISTKVNTRQKLHLRLDILPYNQIIQVPLLIRYTYLNKKINILKCFTSDFVQLNLKKYLHSLSSSQNRPLQPFGLNQCQYQPCPWINQLKNSSTQTLNLCFSFKRLNKTKNLMNPTWGSCSANSRIVILRTFASNVCWI